MGGDTRQSHWRVRSAPSTPTEPRERSISVRLAGSAEGMRTRAVSFDDETSHDHDCELRPRSLTEVL